MGVSNTTFANFFSEELNSTSPFYSNQNVTVEKDAINLQALGPISAGIPLTANITVVFDWINITLDEKYGLRSNVMVGWNFSQPSFVTVTLDGAYTIPQQKDAYGLPTWATINLQPKNVSNSASYNAALSYWTNTVTVQYYDNGAWGYTVYFGPYSSYLNNPYCYTADGDPHGAVIEPYGEYLSDKTNSLIASFSSIIIVLALLDLRKRHHEILDFTTRACPECDAMIRADSKYCDHCGTRLDWQPK